MKSLAQVAAVVLGSLAAAFAQTADGPPKSLAEIARDSQKEKKVVAKIVLSDDTQQLRKSIIDAKDAPAMFRLISEEDAKY